jgi:hypothetical protein
MWMSHHPLLLRVRWSLATIEGQKSAHATWNMNRTIGEWSSIPYEKLASGNDMAERSSPGSSSFQMLGNDLRKQCGLFSLVEDFRFLYLKVDANFVVWSWSWLGCYHQWVRHLCSYISYSSRNSSVLVTTRPNFG